MGEESLPSLDNREKILAEGPPLTWYFGGGLKDRGISSVTLNNPLTDMGEGKVGKQMEQWMHYTGNTMLNKNVNPEALARAQQAIQEAERFVTEVTGFSPQQINEKRSRLSKMFKGKTTVPFPFELYEEDETK